MIRYAFILAFLFMGCMPKKNQKTRTLNDSISKVTNGSKTHFAVLNKADQEKIQEEYIVEDKEGWLYNPYDFPLEVDAIKALLGNGVEIKEEYVEENEYGDGFIHTKIIYGDTRLGFYDYEGKHEAKITTSKLPLVNGIKIGMDRQAFIKAMNFNDEKAAKAHVFSLVDDYGAMTFSFRKDTLYLIEGHYEEGD